jgi:hypothetical protein
MILNPEVVEKLRCLLLTAHHGLVPQCDQQSELCTLQLGNEKSHFINNILVNSVGNLTQESQGSWFDTPFQEWIGDYHQNMIAAVRLVPATLPASLVLAYICE